MNHRATLALATAAAIASCGPADKKPVEKDVIAYLNQTQPSFVHITGASLSFDAIKPTGPGQTVPGSWRVSVDFTLQTQQDLYARAPNADATRLAFDQAVSASEGFRPARIAKVNELAAKIGLLAPGADNPEPAIEAVLVNPKNTSLKDHVTLLAQPDGGSWKFYQLDAQSLSDSAIGYPLDDLRHAYPHDAVVLLGSPEDKSFQDRQKKFLDALTRAGKP